MRNEQRVTQIPKTNVHIAHAPSRAESCTDERELQVACKHLRRDAGLTQPSHGRRPLRLPASYDLHAVLNPISSTPEWAPPGLPAFFLRWP